ncbi:MAG: hypothetical protein QW667_08345 [Candidatus Bathyarchaeia archaeon]
MDKLGSREEPDENEGRSEKLLEILCFLVFVLIGFLLASYLRL